MGGSLRLRQCPPSSHGRETERAEAPGPYPTFFMYAPVAQPRRTPHTSIRGVSATHTSWPTATPPALTSSSYTLHADTMRLMPEGRQQGGKEWAGAGGWGGGAETALTTCTFSKKKEKWNSCLAHPAHAHPGTHARARTHTHTCPLNPIHTPPQSADCHQASTQDAAGALPHTHIADPT